MSERITRDRGKFVGDVAELTHEQLADDSVREEQASLPREIRGTTQETSVHSGVIKIILGATAWFLVVTWMSFARGGDVDFAITVAILFFLFFLGLFLLTSSYAASDPRWNLRKTSFNEFLDSDVATATGKMRGRDVLIEIATVPVSLALAATMIGLIWVALH
jgi:hypothetical protein